MTAHKPIAPGIPRCAAHSREGDRCSYKPRHLGRHRHYAETWWSGWAGDFGRPSSRVDAWLAS